MVAHTFRMVRAFCQNLMEMNGVKNVIVEEGIKNMGKNSMYTELEWLFPYEFA